MHLRSVCGAFRSLELDVAVAKGLVGELVPPYCDFDHLAAVLEELLDLLLGALEMDVFHENTAVVSVVFLLGLVSDGGHWPSIGFLLLFLSFSLLLFGLGLSPLAHG